MKQLKKARLQLPTKKATDIMFEDKSDKILQGAFFVSICLVIWGILIYRLTIINFNYLFGVVVVGTVIALYLINRFLKSSYSKFWIFFISSVVGGGTLYFGLFFLNQIFADKKIVSKEFSIIETGNLGRGKKVIVHNLMLWLTSMELKNNWSFIVSLKRQ